MRSKNMKDLNGDGKVDSREQAISNLGLNAVQDTEDKPDRPPFKNGAGASQSGTKPREDCINQAGVDGKYLDMFEHDPNEVIVEEIKKHPIGLVAIWGITILLIIGLWAVVAAISYYRDRLASTTSGFTGSSLTTAALAIAICLTVLALLFGYVAHFLYVNNRIIVTSEKIVQIRYFSLFNRKVSSLSMGDVQDVTVRRNGILPMWFGFGKVSIETAGEQDNYEFPLATNAEESAKNIVQWHEENLHKYGN